MATKADFTAQEWEVLRDAPHLVMLSVATAGSSGPIGSIKEAFAPLGAIIEAAKGNDELLRGVCDREELKAAQQSIRNSITAGGDAKALRDQLQIAAAEKAAAANFLLKQKGSPQDLNAFRKLLIWTLPTAPRTLRRKAASWDLAANVSARANARSSSAFRKRWRISGYRRWFW